MTKRAGMSGGQMTSGGEERRCRLDLHWLTATAPNRTQMAGYADPHFLQTLDAHTSGMGYGNRGGLEGRSWWGLDWLTTVMLGKGAMSYGWVAQALALGAYS
eukprot:2324070-Rhodomonas_salina.2